MAMHLFMCIDALLTNKELILLTKSLCSIFLATSISDLLVLRYVLASVVCLHSPGNGAGQGSQTLCPRWLGWPLANRAFHRIALSVTQARKSSKEVLVEHVQAWKGLGLGEALQANRALQLFLHYFKNIRNTGNLFSHDNYALITHQDKESKSNN